MRLFSNRWVHGKYKRSYLTYSIVCTKWVNRIDCYAIINQWWLIQENYATLTLDSSGEIENLQWKKNWTAKPTNLKDNAFCHQSSRVNRSWFEYCRSWKNSLGKLAVAVNTGGHLSRVLNKRSVSDGGNLCPLWLGNAIMLTAYLPYLELFLLGFRVVCSLFQDVLLNEFT